MLAGATGCRSALLVDVWQNLLFDTSAVDGGKIPNTVLTAMLACPLLDNRVAISYHLDTGG